MGEQHRWGEADAGVGSSTDGGRLTPVWGSSADGERLMPVWGAAQKEGG